MKTLWALAFGVLFGLLAAGVLLLVVRQPQGQAIQLSPAPTPPPLIVHVAGAVVRPGVCKVSPGSRVQDAIQAAGGLVNRADETGLNMAAFVQDGDLIRVPFQREDPPVETVPVVEVGESGERSGWVQVGGLLDINTASVQELETLPGIGPVTAQKVIAYREANGPFPDIESIQDVPGIGPVTFEKIKDLITVGWIP